MAGVYVKEGKKGLAVKRDCKGRYVYLNPRGGAQIAVAESARNVACTGATPVAVTNCLNFGNPYKPGVYWQFKEAIAGIGEACRVFDTPVTGGNVSFYNESPTASVYPTPVIGMLGVLDDIRRSPRAAFLQQRRFQRGNRRGSRGHGGLGAGRRPPRVRLSEGDLERVGVCVVAPSGHEFQEPLHQSPAGV